MEQDTETVEQVKPDEPSGQDIALAQTKFILWVTVGGVVFLTFYIVVLAFGRS